jgi:hypothetical protein
MKEELIDVRIDAWHTLDLVLIYALVDSTPRLLALVIEKASE